MSALVERIIAARDTIRPLADYRVPAAMDALADAANALYSYEKTAALRAKDAEIAALKEALRPFAACAEHDIGESEADADTFRNSTHNRAPKITVGDFRRVLSVLSAPVGAERDHDGGK